MIATTGLCVEERLQEVSRKLEANLGFDSDTIELGILNGTEDPFTVFRMRSSDCKLNTIFLFLPVLKMQRSGQSEAAKMV
jgi:hypothetical protein